MREERPKRRQALRAAALLREDLEYDEEKDEAVEKHEPSAHKSPFYSYNEALENKEELEDPRKEAREKERREAAEAKAALALLQEERKSEEERRRKREERDLLKEGPVEKKARQESEGDSPEVRLSNLNRLSAARAIPFISRP